MKTNFMTDQGQVRPVNEDAGGVFYHTPNQVLAIVADGMGGHNAGEVASSLAVRTLENKWNSIPDNLQAEDAAAWIKEAINEANKIIFDHSRNDAALEGMGTTIVLAICTEDYLAIGHVGDSRAYLMKNGNINQVTEDHSLVNELLKTGQISEGDAEEHPRKNVLLRAVGTEENVEADIHTFTWQEGDTLLLCSDGLINKISDEEIKRLYSTEKDNETWSKELMHAANERGGEDNITLAVVRYEHPDQSGDALC